MLTRHTAALTLAAGLCASISPAPAWANEPDDLPVTEITLYRSGVGSFVRAGEVDGDADVSLRFRTDQVNDILKSMIVLDLDGGRVTGATYGSKEPLSRRLASFAVDISDNPSQAQLLDRLRGARVEVRTTEGTQQGSVLGVEFRELSHPVHGTPITSNRLSLVTDSGVWSGDIDQILSFRILDEALADELNKALLALAEHRADNVKTVDLNFRGDGQRDVLVGYVQETPVWKASYRLGLPPEGEGPLSLQGWAIVENTTEEDWEEVELSLVAGQPVSFVMDLYEPLYVTRPEVGVPTGAGVSPRNYAGGQSPFQDDQADAARGRDAGDPAPRMMSLARRAEVTEAEAFGIMNKSVAATASGETIGEVFQFTLDAPVSVGRQQSAMLPVIAGDISGRRVSIFNASDGRSHPMRGVEITNDTGNQLMPGPIAVYDGTTYAGDALIRHVSRGDDRLLAYAVDLDVDVRTEPRGTSTVQRLTIVRGMMRQHRTEENGTTYHFDSNDRFRDRTIIVEHQKLSGWELVDSPNPDELADSLYRFEIELDPGGNGRLDVTQRRTTYDSYALLDFSADTLMRFSRQGKVSDEVVAAFREAQRLRGLMLDSERRIADLEAERTEIGADQQRVRSNMGSIDRASELYARYMQKLGEQESRLESIETDLSGQRAMLRDRTEALESFIESLNVG